MATISVRPLPTGCASASGTVPAVSSCTTTTEVLPTAPIPRTACVGAASRSDAAVADRRLWLGVLVFAALSLLAIPDARTRAGLEASSAPEARDEVATSAPALRVQGNRLLDPAGRPIELRGVNRMGLEFSCVQGKGLGQPFDQHSIDALRSWGVNVVRLPLNEHCWLGVGGEPSGEAYRESVARHVDLLVSNDMFVILDLHWSAPRTRLATGWDPMPNTDYSAMFWSSVADRFKREDRVIFDLFNEPAPNNNESDETDGPAERSWRCWRDGAAGGMCDATQLRGMAGADVAGMQSLVDAVRTMGATNVIMLGGIQFANTLWSNSRRNWLEYRP